MHVIQQTSVRLNSEEFWKSVKVSELDMRRAAGTVGPGTRETSKWLPGLWAVPVCLSHLARPEVLYAKQDISSSKETKAG